MNRLQIQPKTGFNIQAPLVADMSESFEQAQVAKTYDSLLQFSTQGVGAISQGLNRYATSKDWEEWKPIRDASKKKYKEQFASREYASEFAELFAGEEFVPPQERPVDWEEDKWNAFQSYRGTKEAQGFQAGLLQISEKYVRDSSETGGYNPNTHIQLLTNYFASTINKNKGNKQFIEAFVGTASNLLTAQVNSIRSTSSRIAGTRASRQLFDGAFESLSGMQFNSEADYANTLMANLNTGIQNYETLTGKEDKTFYTRAADKLMAQGLLDATEAFLKTTTRSGEMLGKTPEGAKIKIDLAKLKSDPASITTQLSSEVIQDDGRPPIQGSLTWLENEIKRIDAGPSVSTLDRNIAVNKAVDASVQYLDGLRSKDLYASSTDARRSIDSYILAAKSNKVTEWASATSPDVYRDLKNKAIAGQLTEMDLENNAHLITQSNFNDLTKTMLDKGETEFRKLAQERLYNTIGKDYLDRNTVWGDLDVEVPVILNQFLNWVETDDARKYKLMYNKWEGTDKLATREETIQELMTKFIQGRNEPLGRATASTSFGKYLQRMELIDAKGNILVNGERAEEPTQSTGIIPTARPPGG